MGKSVPLVSSKWGRSEPIVNDYGLTAGKTNAPRRLADGPYQMASLQCVLSMKSRDRDRE